MGVYVDLVFVTQDIESILRLFFVPFKRDVHKAETMLKSAREHFAEGHHIHLTRFHSGPEWMIGEEAYWHKRKLYPFKDDSDSINFWTLAYKPENMEAFLVDIYIVNPETINENSLDLLLKHGTPPFGILDSRVTKAYRFQQFLPFAKVTSNLATFDIYHELAKLGKPYHIAHILEFRLLTYDQVARYLIERGEPFIQSVLQYMEIEMKTIYNGQAKELRKSLNQ